MKGLFKALNMGISMFTIIPLPKYCWDEREAKNIMKLYPFIGGIIGILWYLIFLILAKLEVSAMLSSGILLAIPFILTGFLHLDGFMDVCDALLSRRSKEEKIRILKDSTVGAFAVISLVLLFIIEFSAINTIVAEGKNPLFLIIIPIVSRAIAAYSLISMDTIGESYLGKLFKEGTGKLDKIILAGIYVIGLIASYYILQIKGVFIMLAMGILSVILLINAEKQLGGVNGDVAGYILVLSEFVGIIALAIF